MELWPFIAVLIQYSTTRGDISRPASAFFCTPAKPMFSGVFWNQPAIRVSVCVQNTYFCQRTDRRFKSLLVTALVYFIYFVYMYIFIFVFYVFLSVLSAMFLCCFYKNLCYIEPAHRPPIRFRKQLVRQGDIMQSFLLAQLLCCTEGLIITDLLL